MKSLQSTVYSLQLWLLVILFFLLPVSTQAGGVTELRNPLGTAKTCVGANAARNGAVCDVPSLAGFIIRAVLGIVGAVALLMFIWGGFLWLTAAGNPDKIKQGKNTLVWATIGLVFIFSSYIIANFIINALTGGS